MGYKKITALVITALVAVSVSAPGFADTTLKGDLVEPVWVGNQQIVVGSVKTVGLEYYLVNAVDGSSKVVIPEEKNATEVAASADGTMIAYTNDNGDIFKMNLSDMKEEKISSDNEPKAELIWSGDSQKVFFLKGEKLDVISAVTVATKKTADVLADKVAYKSDLFVSFNGKRLIYTVTNAGTTDATTLAVSTKGTEPQIYRLDLTQKNAKPMKMTSSLDNKSYSFLTESGAVIYLSTDPSSPVNKSVARITSSDGKSNSVMTALDNARQTMATPDGNAWSLTVNGSGKQMVYNIAANAERFEVPVTVQEITLSPDANKAIVILPGKDSSNLQIISKTGTKTLN